MQEQENTNDPVKKQAEELNKYMTKEEIWG